MLNPVSASIESDQLPHRTVSSRLTMSVPEYVDRGPVKITPNIDLQHLVDKSVVITGGEGLIVINLTIA
jgi:hypothetical protein